MAWTQTDIDNLKAAIASGIKQVSYNGPPARTVIYQDADAMWKALAAMQAEVQGASKVTHRFASTSKGC